MLENQTTRSENLTKLIYISVDGIDAKNKTLGGLNEQQKAALRCKVHQCKHKIHLLSYAKENGKEFQTTFNVMGNIKLSYVAEDIQYCKIIIQYHAYPNHI